MPPTAPYVYSTLIRAVARAYRWRNMLETARYATIKEIAKAEKINPSYVSRVLRLTLLAPATVEAILHARANAAPTLTEAMKVFPVEWTLQQSPRRGARLELPASSWGISRPLYCGRMTMGP